jgi:hypothetical protein
MPILERHLADDDHDLRQCGRARRLGLAVAVGTLVAAGVLALEAITGWGSHSHSVAPHASGAGQQSAALGARHVENGVVVGYQQTAIDSVVAATNYATVINGSLVLDPEKLRAAIRTVTAPGSLQRLLTNTEQTLDSANSAYGLITNAHSGIAVIVRFIPVAWHLDRFDGTEAQVSIWAVAVFAEAGVVAPRQNWITVTYSLAWLGGDWKLTDAGATPGPVPSVTEPGQQANADIPIQMRDFKEYRLGV